MRRGHAVAIEALTWLDTPFKWQQSAKGQGCDCKGLLWGVARELGFPEAESIYAKVANYSADRPVPSALLREGMAALYDRVPSADDALPGDVLLLRFKGGKPAHIAIVTFDGRAVHARIGHSNRVREVRIAALWHKYEIDSVWRWRDLRDEGEGIGAGAE